MRTKVMTIMLLAACQFMRAACFHEDMPPAPVERVQVGDPLPAMELLMNDSTWVTTESLRGRWVVLVLFSVKCGDCRRALPEVQRFYDRLPLNDSTAVLAVSRAEGDSLVAPFWHELSLTFPYSAQTDDHIYRLFADRIVPRIYIANPQGFVVHTFDDAHMPSAELLLDAIK